MRKFINYIALKQVIHTLVKQFLIRISPSLAHYELFKDVLYLIVDLLVAELTLTDSNDRISSDSHPDESLSNLNLNIYGENEPQR